MNATNPNGNTEPLASDRIRETFQADPKGSVAVLDGHGVRLHVDRGQLRALDGVADVARHRSWGKATHGLSRIAVIASTGDLSIPALRWCRGAGVGVVVVDPFDQGVLATSAHTANDDPRLRRAQALALGTAVGLEVTRRLIAHKLSGQARNSKAVLGRPSDALSIEAIVGALSSCETIEEIRQLEAVGANIYFAGWRDLDVPFIRRDQSRVPNAWRTFEGRRSAVNPGTARSATDPLNALLNFGYRLLEAEARFACLAIGLDPGIGIMHSDVKGRDSMVLDLMEAVRPEVDRWVLQLLRRRPLSKSDFAEDARGVVRVRAPLTHELAQAMPTWGRALGGVVEETASLLATASPYEVSVASVLTRSKHKEAARRRADAPRSGATGRLGPNPGGLAPTRKARQRPSSVDSATVPRCQTCGKPVPKEADRATPRSNYCPTCRVERRSEVGHMIQAESQKLGRSKGDGATRDRRSTANAEQRLTQQRWELEHDAEMFDREWFVTTVVPVLRAVTLTTIARATGMSTSAAAKVRAGRRVPHPRHWEALAALGRVPM
jgi:CRISPR-associated endonuclease Cas1